MQDKTNIDFDKIISRVSDVDMVMPPPAKGEDEVLSYHERRKMIATFARYVVEGHPGFTTENAPNIAFPDKVKNKFKTELVKMYMQPEDKTVTEMGRDLYKFSKKYIPDNHFNIFAGDGKLINLGTEGNLAFKQELAECVQNDNINASQKGVMEHLYSERNQVGKNLFNDDEIQLLQQKGTELLSDKKGQTWRMTEVSHQNQKIMLLGMTSFAAVDGDGKFSEDLIKDFTALAKEFSKQAYNDCDALILDLRGNGGGWPYIGDYMARTLYGNTVSTEPQGHLKMDTLAAKLSYAYMEGKKPGERLRLLHEDKNTKYTQRNKPWDEEYPFNAAMGYTKPILILTDQNTGSNAELTIGRLREHPFVRTIGEHSCGVVQYHPAAIPQASVPLPYGLKIALPPEGFTGPKGERLEGIGYQPDFPVQKGQDALQTAIEKFAEIKQDIMQHLPPEKTVNTTAKREAKVDETTARNIKIIGQNKASLLAAFDELVEATANIPQLKKQNAHYQIKPRSQVLTH